MRARTFIRINTVQAFAVSNYFTLMKYLIPYLFGYKTGLSLSRMSTNNQIGPMQFCCNTGFTLPKQSQRSRSVLEDGSRFLGLFWKEKNTVL